MRQLQVLEKPGRLDVVRMGQDELLILRRRTGSLILAQFARTAAPGRTSAMAIALRSHMAEDQAVAAGELRRLRSWSRLELVDHLAFGEVISPISTPAKPSSGPTVISTATAPMRISPAKGWLRRIAALGRVAEASRKPSSPRASACSRSARPAGNSSGSRVRSGGGVSSPSGSPSGSIRPSPAQTGR